MSGGFDAEQLVARAWRGFAARVGEESDAVLPPIWLMIGWVGVAIAHACAPFVVCGAYQFDLFVPLDGGWRVYSGQTPHIDFHSPVGALYYEAYGLAMRAFGPTARVLLYVPAIASPILALLAWFATRDRLSGLLRCAIATFVGLLALSPACLDDARLTHLASYNSVGWAMAVVVGLVATLAPRRADRAAVDGVIVAALLVGLFFLKVTLFGFALGAALLGVLLVPNARRGTLAGLAGFALVVGGLFALSPVPAAYLRDIASAIAASRDTALASHDAGRVPGVAKAVTQLWFNAVGIVVGLWAALGAIRHVEGTATEGAIARTGLVVLGLLGGMLVIGQQNHDNYLPVVVVSGAVGVQAALRVAGERAWVHAAAAVLLGVIAAGIGSGASAVGRHFGAGLADPDVLWAPFSDGNAAALRFGGQSHRTPPLIQQVIDGTMSAETYRTVAPEPPVADVAVLFGAGVDALRDAGVPATAKTWTLIIAEPYGFVRGAPSPRGLSSWNDPGRTFGAEAPVTGAHLADVDAVMVPHAVAVDPATEPMFEALRADLERDFVPTQTPLWTVWIRR